MALYGTGSAFLGVAPAPTVGDVIPARGGTSSRRSRWPPTWAPSVGPLVAGTLADTYSFGAAFGVTAAVIAAGLLTAALSTETKHRPDVEDPDPEPSPGTSG